MIPGIASRSMPVGSTKRRKVKALKLTWIVSAAMLQGSRESVNAFALGATTDNLH